MNDWELVKVEKGEREKGQILSEVSSDQEGGELCSSVLDE
jgi:hypothetical protein